MLFADSWSVTESHQGLWPQEEIVVTGKEKQTKQNYLVLTLFARQHVLGVCVTISRPCKMTVISIWENIYTFSGINLALLRRILFCWNTYMLLSEYLLYQTEFSGFL